VQGKGVVNSISLKEGEAEFVDQARTGAPLRRRGHRDGVRRAGPGRHGCSGKVQICTPRLPAADGAVGFPPEDIIFDPNIFAVGTGIEEHADYGVAFIEATRADQGPLPGARSQRRHQQPVLLLPRQQMVREAMHSVFLYHAMKAGMDMGIVNAGQLAVYDGHGAELRERVEDVVLNRRADATERLLRSRPAGQGRRAQGGDRPWSWRDLPVAKRLEHALVTGITDSSKKTPKRPSPRKARPARRHRGAAHGRHERGGRPVRQGKMFLPQVVKSARVMKKAVAYLQPYIEEEKRQDAHPCGPGKVLMATVKGDVHDIGKNIVGVVLQCNGYEVIDLGVMVPCAEDHRGRPAARGGAMIGLSGLITPSLDEMVHVASEMQREGFSPPPAHRRRHHLQSSHGGQDRAHRHLPWPAQAEAASPRARPTNA
jgi:5-methyltetrahydrofolate--homocysteine methyltransferase